jgi:hypothetical protein
MKLYINICVYKTDIYLLTGVLARLTSTPVSKTQAFSLLSRSEWSKTYGGGHF